MAKYDSPGFHPETFGLDTAFGNGRDHGMTGSGTDGTRIADASDASHSLGSAVISSPHASSQVAEDMPTKDVRAIDTQVPGQVPEREPFSGVGNTWRETFPGEGGPSAHVATPHHPNAARS